MRCTTAFAVLALAACDPSRPYTPALPPDVGPFPGSEPVRLTFYDLDDKLPRVTGDLLVFTRQDRDGEPQLAYAPTGRETCIAMMPAAGGTILREYCPDRLVPDTLVDTWFGATLSPDGTRLAFNWQRGYRVSALGYRDTYLVVTPAGTPADTTHYRREVRYVRNPDGNPVIADVAGAITWVTDTRLRFLATHQFIFKVKGGGAERVTETSFTPLALLELDLATGVSAIVPGGDSVIAYAAAPGGSLWVVRETAPDVLESLDPVSGVRDTLGTFGGAVTALAAVDGVPVAIINSIRVERLDFTTGTAAAVLAFGRPMSAIAAADGRRYIVEVEQELKLFGARTDLWLMTLP